MAVGKDPDQCLHRYSAENLYAASDESKCVYQCCITSNQNL